MLTKARNKSKHLKLPPGPSQLPLIGSIHHLLKPHTSHNLMRHLSNTCGPLMHLKLGQVSLVVTSSSRSTKEILKTHDLTFSTRPLFPAAATISYNGKKLSFALYGEYWRQMRKLCVLELLSAKQVQSFQRIREEEAQKLVAYVDSNSKEAVNVSKSLARLANNVVLRAVVRKVSEEVQEKYLEAMCEMVEVAGGFNLSDLFPSFEWLINLFSGAKAKAERCHERMDDVLEGFVREHMARRGGEMEGSEDMLDVVLRLQREGDDDVRLHLTDDAVKGLIMDMLNGGSETSSSVMQFAVSELIRHQTSMKKAQMEVRSALEGKDSISESDVKELKYLKNVIKETLRLHPPLPMLVPRECQKECKVMGYDVPEKSRVIVNAWAIGRDSDYWEDGEEFKPERFEENAVDFKGGSFELLAFGAGRRMCPGMLFGLATMELPLALLLYYFDWELPIDGEMRLRSLDMSESFGITAHRKYGETLFLNERGPVFE